MEKLKLAQFDSAVRVLGPLYPLTSLPDGGVIFLLSFFLVSFFEVRTLE